MEWWNNVIRGLGTANAPFGFAPVDSPSQGQVDPAYNAGMQMLGNVGMGMLASGEKNPMTALGKSYLVASQNAQQQNKDQYVAAQMLQEADAKKQERAREQEKQKWLEDQISQLDPKVQGIARMMPEKFFGAQIEQMFPKPNSGNTSNWGMSVVPLKNKRTGELVAGQFNQGQGGIFINGQPADPSEWAFDPGALAQDKAIGTKEGGAIGEARGDLPGAMKQAEVTSAKITSLKNDPNLNAALGWTSYMPDMAVSNKVIDVRAKVDELMGGAFLEARTTLKGGGQITDFESARAERAYARMERAIQSSDPKVFREALDDFNQAVNDGVSKLRATARVPDPSAGGAPEAGAEEWTIGPDGKPQRVR